MVLAEKDICGLDKQVAPRWEKDEWALRFTVPGRQGKTTYYYSISLSGDELARLVDVAISESTGDVAARAFGKAVGCFLREIITSSPGTNKKNA